MSRDTYPKSYVDLNRAPEGRGLPFTNHSAHMNHSITRQTITRLALQNYVIYRGADKFLAQPGRKQATVREDFDFRISYL